MVFLRHLCIKGENRKLQKCFSGLKKKPQTVYILGNKDDNYDIITRANNNYDILTIRTQTWRVMRLYF